MNRNDSTSRAPYGRAWLGLVSMVAALAYLYNRNFGHRVLTSLTNDQTDRSLEREAQAVLNRSVEHPEDVNLKVTNGEVIVEGSLPDQESYVLQERLLTIPGVNRVENHIH